MNTHDTLTSRLASPSQSSLHFILIATPWFQYRYSAQIDTIRNHATATSSSFSTYTGAEYCSSYTQFYTRKLCTVDHILSSIVKEGDWIAVQDVDMIVNPKLSLQKSLLNSIIDPALKSQPDLSLILLKRHTNEYCAGVYLLKNNSFGRAFIKTWLSTLISTYSSTSDVGVNGDNGVLHQVILSLASPSSSNPCTSLFTPEKYTKKFLPCFHSTLLTLPPSPFIKYLPLATSYTSEIFYTCSATSCHPTVYSHSSTFFLHGLKDFDQEHFMEGSIQIEWVERIDMRRVNEDYEFFKEWRRKKVIGGWVMNVTVFVVLGVMLWAVFKKFRSKKKWRRRV